MILLYLEGSGSKFQSVNTKTSQFCPFFGVQELRKKHVNTKNSQFSTFFGFQELRKSMYIYIYKYVHMYITWFCYIWRVVVLSFIPSTPKLVNFPHFLDSRSWEKKHVNTKASQFSTFFGFQELRKNMSTPKLVNSPHFWIPGVEKKHVYISIYIHIICIYIYMYISILHDFALFGG